jgi:hypothetical protein
LHLVRQVDRLTSRGVVADDAFAER